MTGYSFVIGIIFLFLTQICWSASSSCGTVRMDHPPGAMSSVPVLDQGPTGLCYAAVAAQMTDAYLAAHGGKDQLVSFSHAAALYQDKKAISDIYDTLEEKMGLISKIKSGTATENERKIYDNIQSQIQSQITNPNDSHATKADLNIGETFSTLQALRENKWACGIDRENYNDANIEATMYPFLKARQDVLLSGSTNSFSEQFECIANRTLPSNQVNQLGNLKRIADKIVNDLPDKGKYIVSVIENTCPKKIDLSKIPAPQQIKFNSEEVRSGGFIADKIQNLLNQPQPSPIGVSFGGNNLYTNTPDFGHWALIVGREEVNGVCRVIIRDSYGANCKGVLQGSIYKYPCENGQISVPLTEFSKMQVRSATWLPN